LEFNVLFSNWNNINSNSTHIPVCRKLEERTPTNGEGKMKLGKEYIEIKIIVPYILRDDDRDIIEYAKNHYPDWVSIGLHTRFIKRKLQKS
jgi:hypothetical protein